MAQVVYLRNKPVLGDKAWIEAIKGEGLSVR